MIDTKKSSIRYMPIAIVASLILSSAKIFIEITGIANKICATSPFLCQTLSIEFITILISITIIIALWISKIEIEIDTKGASANKEIGEHLGFDTTKLENRETIKNELSFAVQNLSLFDKFLSYAIISWGVFYLIQGLIYVAPQIAAHTEIVVKYKQEARMLADFILNCINLFNTIFLFICYYILSYNTSKEDDKNGIGKPKFRFNRGTVLFTVFVPIVIVILDLIVKGICLSDKFKDYEKIVIVGLMHLLIGVVSGVVLGLITGRLDSKFIQPKKRFIGVLYLYAVAQTAYPLLELKIFNDYINSEIINSVLLALTTTVMIVGIAGKASLVYIFSQSHKSRTLLLYFLRLRTYNGISKANTTDFKNKIDPYIHS